MSVTSVITESSAGLQSALEYLSILPLESYLYSEPNFNCKMKVFVLLANLSTPLTPCCVRPTAV